MTRTLNTIISRLRDFDDGCQGIENLLPKQSELMGALIALISEQAPGIPVTITPSDVTEYGASYIRSLRVGTGGNLTVVTQDGTSVAINNVQDGELLPVRDIKKVMSTGTTASDIVALT